MEEEWTLALSPAEKVARMLAENGGLNDEQQKLVRACVMDYHAKQSTSKLDSVLKTEYKFQILLRLVSMLYRQFHGPIVDPSGELTLTLEDRRGLAVILLGEFNRLFFEYAASLDPELLEVNASKAARVAHFIKLVTGDDSDFFDECEF